VANVIRAEGVEEKIPLNQKALKGSRRVRDLSVVASVAKEPAAFGP
jgi:hypothetical protein